MFAWQTLRRFGGTIRSRKGLTGAGRLALCAVLAGGLPVLAPGSAAVAQPPPGAQGPPPGVGGGPFADLELELAMGTYVGFCRNTQGVQDVAVDPAGNAVVVGFIPRDCDRGTFQILLQRFSPDGTRLFRDSLGGVTGDVGNGVALDAEGNIYITGSTVTDPVMRGVFPVVDPFQGEAAGDLDAFVMKLDPTGQTILYSTFLGGSDMDVGTGIAVDDAGRIVVVGTTRSTDFPTEAPLQESLAGEGDAFVTVFEPDGSDLAFSTYFGGAGNERSSRVATLRDRIYFTGSTGSPDLPTRVRGRGDALAADYGGGPSDAFAARIDRFEGLGYAGFLGGGGEDAGYGLDVDRRGAAYVTGTTDSADFPTVRPLQGSLTDPPEADAFVVQLTPSGSNARYSTYLDAAGSAVCSPPFPATDFCTAVAVAGNGTAFVTLNGFFGKAVSKNGGRLLGELEGYGGTSVEVADDGSVYAAGISEGFPLPLANQPDPAQSHIFAFLGWLVRMTTDAEPGAAADRGAP